MLRSIFLTLPGYLLAQQMYPVFYTHYQTTVLPNQKGDKNAETLYPD